MMHINPHGSFRQLQLLIESGIDEGRDVVLCSPFIKRPAFRWVLDQLHERARLMVFTRWRLNEIAAGISDMDIWRDMAHRGNATLHICHDLHAKYYRIGKQAVLGSANLTGAGMGLNPVGNLELLVPANSDFPCAAFEEILIGESILVDEALYSNILEAIQEVCVQPIWDEPLAEQVSPPVSFKWTPHTRSPAQLFAAYTGEETTVTGRNRQFVLEDLVALSIPAGLSESGFRRLGAASLGQQPYFRQVFCFCAEPRRFGAVRDWIMETGFAGGDREQASRLWQTTIRWLGYFFPESLQLSVPGAYSEVVQLL